MSDFFIDEIKRLAKAKTPEELAELYETFCERKLKHSEDNFINRQDRKMKKKQRDIERRNARKNKYRMYDF